MQCGRLELDMLFYIGTQLVHSGTSRLETSSFAQIRLEASDRIWIGLLYPSLLPQWSPVDPICQVQNPDGLDSQRQINETRSVWNRLSRELSGQAEGRRRSKLTLVPSESSSASGPARADMELQDVSVDDASDGGPTQESTSVDVDELTERAAAMQLESAPSPMPRPPGLQLQIPNPFEPSDQPVTDELMQTVGPASSGQRVAAAPALPQPPRFEGRTMQDRRNFMRRYEIYLTAINALQTQWGGAFAMPVGACIESRTKRMVARYEFNMAPHLITEEQWIEYFMKANTPSHVDYPSVDEAMKKLQMRTTWPEPESRIMNLQANLEALLDQFNLTEVTFEHEQRRIVKYLANALAPASFKAAIATKLSLHENKRYKNEVGLFCA
ncbi:unnamed protein product [Phytophthora fragariaefolia]|uniref:Unnamed protein product n=1 Tax=Phytophthora fragariaefolia TaxID=1490495 RepID=A0A9W6WIK7_9STRA|nr:unnamed protein product [Phytophthora fragariaefolia]